MHAYINYMIEFIYIIGAVITFFAQLKNGFLTALITAILWPIMIVGLSLFTFFGSIYYANKKK